jgi:competence protein ComEA
VVLNLANAADLRKLPGVGQKRAEALLALRQKLGKFRRVSDLLRVKGIGPKRLKQWQDKVVLDAETTPALTAPAAPAAPQPAAARPAAESRGDAT